MGMTAVDSSIEYTAGYKVPGEEGVRSFSFQRGLNKIDSDLLDELRKDKKSPTSIHFDAGDLVEKHASTANKQLDGAVPLERDLRPKPAIQAAAESFARTNNAETAINAGETARDQRDAAQSRKRG